MLKCLLFLIFFILIVNLFFKIIKLQKARNIVNYYKITTTFEKRKNNLNKKNPFKKIVDQIEHAEKYSLNLVITAMLLLMLLGSIIGLIFQNCIVGLISAIFLGFIPIFHILKLERKLQVLIVKTLPSFLAGLKTEYQLKNRLIDSFVAMENKVSDLIKEEYKVFVSELDQNVELYTALYRLAERTKCIWFSHLGDIAEMATSRQDKAGLLRTLDDLSMEIEKSIDETDINLQMIKRAGFYVLVMLSILGFSIIFTSKFIENPLYYFTTTNEGRKHLTIGVLFLVLPISMYYYRVLKEVK